MEEVIRIFSSGDWISLNINGYHREDDLPAVEKYNGDKLWYKNGKLHRKDGPAIECSDGSKSWYKNGKLHRR